VSIDRQAPPYPAHLLDSAASFLQARTRNLKAAIRENSFAEKGTFAAQIERIEFLVGTATFFQMMRIMSRWRRLNRQ